MRRLGAIALGVLALGTARAEGLLVLDDAEGKVGPWRVTEIVSAPVHGGEGALKWDVAKQPTLDSPRFLGDWTAFDELRFCAHLDKPYDYNIPIVFPAEG